MAAFKKKRWISIHTSHLHIHIIHMKHVHDLPPLLPIKALLMRFSAMRRRSWHLMKGFKIIILKTLWNLCWWDGKGVEGRSNQPTDPRGPRLDVEARASNTLGRTLCSLQKLQASLQQTPTPAALDAKPRSVGQVTLWSLRRLRRMHSIYFGHRHIWLSMECLVVLHCCSEKCLLWSATVPN